MTMSTEFETDHGRTDENRTEQDRTEMSKLLEEIAKGAKDTRNRKLIINVEYSFFFIINAKKKSVLIKLWNLKTTIKLNCSDNFLIFVF